MRTNAEVQTTSSHLPALMHRGEIYARAQGRQLKWQNLHICNKDLSGMTYQCPNLNDTKAQPFPTPPYQLSLDISEKVKNPHLSLLQRFNPVDAENTSMGGG